MWVVCPLTTVFYGANENDALCKRILKAFKVQLPMFIVLILLTVPTYIWLNETNVPRDAAKKYGYTEGFVLDDDGQLVYREKLSFFWNLYMVTLLLGSFMMAVFTGIGMVMLPYDLINDFVYRPKLIDKNSWTKRRKVLLSMLIKLREEGKRLEKERIQVDLMKGLSGYFRRYTFSKEMTVWMTQTLLAEKEFDKLED